MTKLNIDPEEWHQEFYDDLFAEQCLQRSPEETQKIVNFLSNNLFLETGDTIFDQGCGLGDVSIPLARLGMRIIGIDLIQSYIERAIEFAQKEQLNCNFYLGNSYEFIPSYPCKAAINWWTSFGYSANDDKNMLMLYCAYNALKSGGIFALDYKNSYRVRRAFADSNKIFDVEKKNGYLKIWESSFDQNNNMIYKNWICVTPNGKQYKKKGGGAKLYTSTDILSMLEKSGFKNIKLYGSVNGEAFIPETSPRCIAIAEVP